MNRLFFLPLIFIASLQAKADVTYQDLEKCGAYKTVSNRSKCWGELASTVLDSPTPTSQSANDQLDRAEVYRCAKEYPATSNLQSVCFSKLLKNPSPLVKEDIAFVESHTKTSSPELPESKVITKGEAERFIQNKILEDKALHTDPANREIYTCMSNNLIDKVFGNANTLQQDEFESRMSMAANQMKKGDLELTQQALRCMANSNAFIQTLKEGNTAASESFASTDLDDLRVDIDEYSGRSVRVQGIGHYVMNMFMMKKTPTDASPMIINITNLNRDQQRTILKECNDIMVGCKVIVYGTVGKVNYQNGIIAENIEFQAISSVKKRKTSK